MFETGSWLLPGAPITATPLPDLTCKFAGLCGPVSEVFILGTTEQMDRQEVPTTARSPPLVSIVYQPLPSSHSQGHRKVAAKVKNFCSCPMDVEDTKQTEHGFCGWQSAGENWAGPKSHFSSSPCLLALPRLTFPSSMWHKQAPAHRLSPPWELLSSGTEIRLWYSHHELALLCPYLHLSPNSYSLGFWR